MVFRFEKYNKLIKVLNSIGGLVKGVESGVTRLIKIWMKMVKENILNLSLRDSM